MMMENQLFEQPVKRSILEKITDYGNKFSYQLQQLISNFRRQPSERPPQADLRSLPEKVQQKRIAERQQTFQSAGGTDSSLVSYGVNKARPKE